VPGQARPFFEKMFDGQHELKPDALARQPKRLKIVDVKTRCRSRTRRSRFNLSTSRTRNVDGMVIAHVAPESGVGDGSDIAARRSAARPLRSPGRCLAQAGITGSTIVGDTGRYRQAGGHRNRVAAN